MTARPSGRSPEAQRGKAQGKTPKEAKRRRPTGKEPKWSGQGKKPKKAKSDKLTRKEPAKMTQESCARRRK